MNYALKFLPGTPRHFPVISSTELLRWEKHQRHWTQGLKFRTAIGPPNS